MKGILIIEDDPSVRENLQDLLKAEGYIVVVASNGVHGLQLAQTQRPDLIICDIMMPELDGYGVLARLRANFNLSTIPFIFLTAKADKPDLRQGMIMGADDYVTKPFTRTELLEAIQSQLQKQANIAHYYKSELYETMDNYNSTTSSKKFNSAGAKILIVDDERAALHMLKRNLIGMGFEVYTAENGIQALKVLRHKAPDLMVLDVGMAEMDGLEVCRQVRQWNNLPIIVLSANDEEEQKVAALELGADDYQTKPYKLNELVARIKAALRRAQLSNLSASSPSLEKGSLKFSCKELTIDFSRRFVTVRGQEVKLTPQQYDLLKYLVENAGLVINHRQALLHSWGAEYERETQYLHVFISQLRQKIEPDTTRPQYLLTERGVGYRFVCPEE